MLGEVYGSRKLDIRSDAVGIGVLASLEMPERAAESRLSNWRVIMRTAHGENLPSLEYDKILAKQFYAKAREVKLKTRKYSIAVDLRPLWLLIQKEMHALREMEDTSRYKLKMLIFMRGRMSGRQYNL